MRTHHFDLRETLGLAACLLSMLFLFNIVLH